MTTQLEAFPKTTMEVLESLRCYHVTAVEKARAALDTLQDDEAVARRYEKAEEKCAAALQIVREIDQAIDALKAMERPTVSEGTARNIMETAARIVNGGALDTDELTVTASVSTGSFTDEVAAELDAHGIEYSRNLALPPFGDPITVEVRNEHVEDPDNPGHDLPAAAHEWDERPCQDCGGEGRLPDRTGGGHHKCKACDGNGSVMVKGDPSPVVVVLYPGSDDPVVTVIGDRTRYSELVADYLATLGPVAEMSSSIDDWQVLAEDELTTNGGGGRNLSAVIQERDYGHRLLVAAADQGSVTGADVDHDYEAAKDAAESAA